MKQIMILLTAVVVVACGSKSPEGTYGGSVDTAVYLSPDELMTRLDSSLSIDCTLKGTVEQVCQAEGCWLKLKKSDGGSLLVRTKDHTFTVPKDIADHTVFVTGLVHWDTTDVATLKDYAKDAGKSDAEIDSITAPEIVPVMEAEGVLVR